MTRFNMIPRGPSGLSRSSFDLMIVVDHSIAEMLLTMVIGTILVIVVSLTTTAASRSPTISISTISLTSVASIAPWLWRCQPLSCLRLHLELLFGLRRRTS